MKPRLFQNTKGEWTLVKPNGAMYKITADLNVNMKAEHFKSTQVIISHFEGFVNEDYSTGTLLHDIPDFLKHTFFKLMKRNEPKSEIDLPT